MIVQINELQCSFSNNNHFFPFFSFQFLVSPVFMVCFFSSVEHKITDKVAKFCAPILCINIIDMIDLFHNFLLE